MGWETDVSMGSSAISGFLKTQNAVSQSNAIAQSADYTVQNMANRTSRTLGSLQTSFLKGGIALDTVGGTQAVFQQAATQGDLDINRTVSNANAQISNTMNSARTSALNGIAAGFSKLGSGTTTNFLTSAWNGIVGNPDPSPQGTGDVGTAVLGSGTGTLY